MRLFRQLAGWTSEAAVAVYIDALPGAAEASEEEDRIRREIALTASTPTSPRTNATTNPT
eukprot:15260965-Alexandrium_andersonii.AAC.1